MDIVLSLLIYNPCESVLLLFLCNFFTGSRIKYTDIIKKHYSLVFLLSSVNLAIQMLSYLFKDMLIIYMIVNIFIVFVVSPVILFFMFSLIGKIKIWQCLLAYIIYVMSMFIIIDIFKLGYDNTKDILFELYGNIIIKVIQIILLLGVIHMKKWLTKIFDKNSKTKAAFTIFMWHNKKMSDKLKDEISQ